MTERAPNRTTYYAQIFVDALVQAGLKHVCIAPGSRSTPLTLAFAQHKGIRVYSHLDERSAAFFALGIGLTRREVAAVVCTSGTAAANFYPAIVEAHMARVPLLVLTADRSPELRYSGANQTIDQVKMYADHVLWSVDMGLPESAPPSVAIRHLQTTAARALAVAQQGRKGAVHLNFPYRKPLEPLWVEGDDLPALDENMRNVPQIYGMTPMSALPSAELLAQLSAIIEAHPNGVIVGGVSWNTEHRYLAELAKRWGYPLLVDGVSPARYAPTQDTVIATGFNHYASALNTLSPDVIVRFGDMPTSKALLDFLDRPAKHYIHISDDGVWADNHHRVNLFVTASITHVLAHTGNFAHTRGNNPICEQVRTWEQTTQAILDTQLHADFFDGAAVAQIVEHLPDDALIFVGNSNAVRHIDQFVTRRKRVRVFANRGASGIDGEISSALGLAAVEQQPVYVIVGDLTFYHDMNGLLAVNRCGVEAVFFVINNNGGGIFERLPIREFEPYHTDYFLTPHGLTFEHAAALYGLEYIHLTDADALARALDMLRTAPRLKHVVEIQTDIRHDEQRRREIIQRAKRS